MGKDVARAAGGREAGAARPHQGDLAAEVKSLQAAADEAQTELDALLRTIGNVVEPGVPSGGEDDYTVLETVGTPRDFAAEGFEPRDHLALAEALDAVDMERGAKVSGARFYFLKGVGARLEMALLALAMDKAIAAGFVPLITPHPRQGRGDGGRGLPRPPRRRGLPARGRRPLPHRHLGGRPRRLPRRRDPRPGSAARSGMPGSPPATDGRPAPTARTPAASSACTSSTRSRCSSTAGPRTRLPSTGACSSMEKDMLATIEVPYRIIDTAAGDLGGPAARKFDCEAWVPTQGRYRELTSTSNCTTFQARRLGTRSRGERGNEVAATLNGTSPRPAGSSLSSRTTSRATVRSSCPGALRSRSGARRPRARPLTPPG